MEDTYKGMSEASYLSWLEELGEERPDQAVSLLSGLLLELSRGTSANVWGSKFCAPLQTLKLFPFQGEKAWVEVVCTSWEEAAVLPRRLAHLCTAAAGLWGCFRGGIVLDFRWCDGIPQKGQLAPLVRFLLAGSEELYPLFLVPPGSTQALRYELRLLDLQQILSEEAQTDKLQNLLHQIDCLTGEEKEQIIQYAQNRDWESAAAMTRTIHRLAAMGREMDVQQLFKQITPPEPTQRKIGFEHEVET